MTQDQDKKFEIIENLKVSFYIIIVIIVIFLIFISVLTYNVISAGEPSGIVMVSFILSVSIIFIIVIIYFMRGLTKNRYFIINQVEIKIAVPNRPEFQILWSELDLVQIRKRGFGKTLMYEIIFITKETSRSFRYKPGADFRVRSNKKIIAALESWCEIKGKDFSGYK